MYIKYFKFDLGKRNQNKRGEAIFDIFSPVHNTI